MTVWRCEIEWWGTGMSGFGSVQRAVFVAIAENVA